MSTQQRVKLGKRGYHLFVSVYNEEPKIQIRKIFQDKASGRSIITKYGTSLSVEEWNDIKQNFQTIDQQLENLPKETNGNANGGQLSNIDKRKVEDMLMMICGEKMKEQLSKLCNQSA